MERISQQLEDLKKSSNKNGPLIKTLEEDKKTLEEQYQKFCKHCAPEKVREYFGSLLKFYLELQADSPKYITLC